MNKLVKILRWPSRPGSGYVPWYVILWRCLWFPVMLVGRLTFILGIFLAFGYTNAARAWRDTQ